MSTTDDRHANRRAWGVFAKDFVAAAEQGWRDGEATWGIWSIPESELRLLPDDLRGLRCLEVGCGTAYVSAWMARRGATVIGLDPTPEQLATARRLEARYGLGVRLVQAWGEALPVADASIDFAISEYGAALWADPAEWIPEVARVMRPGARLVFLTNHAFTITCLPDAEGVPIEARLQRPYLGLRRTTWTDSEGEVEFHLPHGRWIDLLSEHGFAVERLLELGAPEGATGTRFGWATAEWARSWPTEEVWCVRRC